MLRNPNIEWCISSFKSKPGFCVSLTLSFMTTPRSFSPSRSSTSTFTVLLLNKMKKKFKIEWLGARRTQVTFSGEILPPLQVPEFLQDVLQLSRKTFSCIFFFWLKCSCSAFLRSLCRLQYFVFIFLINKVQTSLIKKHMQKLCHF